MGVGGDKEDRKIKRERDGEDDRQRKKGRERRRSRGTLAGFQTSPCFPLSISISLPVCKVEGIFGKRQTKRNAGREGKYE